MLPHSPLLMGAYMHFTTWLGSTQQHKSRLLVFWKIRICASLIDSTAEQARGASQAPALVTDRGKRDPVPRGRVPDELIPVAEERSFSFRRFQHNPEFLIFLHAAARPELTLWIIKWAILAVRGFARLAAAEMTGRNGFAIALVRQQLDKPRLVLNLFVQDS